jgi:16S rRNA (uracil1498-N3)-methyltransferase
MQRSVVKMLSEKEEKKIERWTRICKEASEQAMRLNIPVIKTYKNVKDINCNDGIKLICSTKDKSNTIRKTLQSLTKYDKITVVMGPEGGFTPKEEDYFISTGFIPVTLGTNIMRVETVPLFILSIINYENME